MSRMAETPTANMLNNVLTKALLRNGDFPVISEGLRQITVK